MSLRDEVVSAIANCGAELPADLDDHTSLIRSGLLDSTALFALVLWIEERVAPGLDLTAVNVVEEWDTIAKLVSFVDRHRRAAS